MTETITGKTSPRPAGSDVRFRHHIGVVYEMSNIMELIDAYAEANRAEANVLEQGTDAELVEACSNTRQARTAVVEAVEKLEADAKRYRWLREADQTTAIHLTHYAFDALDTAIDAAMEVTNGQGN